VFRGYSVKFALRSTEAIWICVVADLRGSGQRLDERHGVDIGGTVRAQQSRSWRRPSMASSVSRTSGWSIGLRFDAW